MKKLNTKTSKLSVTNEANVLEWHAKAKVDSPFTNLVALVAGVLDEAASGKDTYMVIGANRERSALLITVSQGGSKAYLSALDIQELSAACGSLL